MAKEFIERGALIARYDAEHVGSPGRARELMATAPAADVVEVVRCKDCKWYSELACGERELLGSQGWCNEVMARPMPSNGFCSFGERENNRDIHKRKPQNIERLHEMNKTGYMLEKDGEDLIFESEKAACEYLGVVKCSISSCYRRGVKCKGYKIAKMDKEETNELD